MDISGKRTVTGGDDRRTPRVRARWRGAYRDGQAQSRGPWRSRRGSASHEGIYGGSFAQPLGSLKSHRLAYNHFMRRRSMMKGRAIWAAIVALASGSAA